MHFDFIAELLAIKIKFSKIIYFGAVITHYVAAPKQGFCRAGMIQPMIKYSKSMVASIALYIYFIIQEVIYLTTLTTSVLNWNMLIVYTKLNCSRPRTIRQYFQNQKARVLKLATSD